MLKGYSSQRVTRSRSSLTLLSRAISGSDPHYLIPESSAFSGSVPGVIRGPVSARLTGGAGSAGRAVPSAPGVGRTRHPQVGRCRATFGCCTETIEKSATYEIPFAPEHRSPLAF